MLSKSNNKRKMKLQKPRINFFLLVSILLMPVLASAEFRSVTAPKAILYDTPSLQGKKLFLLTQGYPVEVVVVLTNWVKVRDKQGALSWMEVKDLSQQRSLLTSAVVEMRQTADPLGVVVGRVDKDVVLEFVEPAQNGWIKVKHRDGIVGFIPAGKVWGL